MVALIVLASVAGYVLVAIGTIQPVTGGLVPSTTCPGFRTMSITSRFLRGE